MLVREYWGGRLGAGAAAEQGGGDGADGQGGHDQHGVPGDRGVEADLGLVEPEAVLSELEIFFGRPAQPCCAALPRGPAGRGTPAGLRADSSREGRARRFPGGGGSAGGAGPRRCPARPRRTSGVLWIRSRPSGSPSRGGGPSANASARMSMASWPLVRKSRSAGRPMTTDVTGSQICRAAIHSRAPISACPVPSRTYDRCTVLLPLATLPTQPRYCPREAWPQQFQQLSTFPAAQCAAYPGGSSRLRFCCLPKRMIGRRLSHARPLPCLG